MVDGGDVLGRGQTTIVELQLSGLESTNDVETTSDPADIMPVIQKHLVETITTLPGTTLEEFRWRNEAINAVDSYCKCQEAGAATRPRCRSACCENIPSIWIFCSGYELVVYWKNQVLNLSRRSAISESDCFSGIPPGILVKMLSTKS
ncbi:hypothetical protein V498_00003 [Pseudogymnoascus sp. VKM F-4517 (FW-2822)]|nr:hypothetical protein V498_00003 [Pseudogymnoascus sp. VKM F-4517 (FW-2822)]